MRAMHDLLDMVEEKKSGDKNIFKVIAQKMIAAPVVCMGFHRV